ncbi:MAG: hypothetical protein U1E70_13090 [Acetobacteraceae bacterium]
MKIEHLRLDAHRLPIPPQFLAVQVDLARGKRNNHAVPFRPSHDNGRHRFKACG